MELLGDVGLEESCFSPFRDGVSVSAREVRGLHQLYNWVKSFWKLPMVLLGYVGHVESCFGPFGDGVSVSAR